MSRKNKQRKTKNQRLAEWITHKLHSRPVTNDDEGNYCWVQDEQQIIEIIRIQLDRIKPEDSYQPQP